MKNKTKDIAFLGIYIALVVGLGYALVVVPNVELVTVMIFLSGVLMGVKRGVIIGGVSELLFSSLNPMGSGLLFPPMLIAQIIAMSIVGAIGGLLREYLVNSKGRNVNVIIIGVIGFGLTLFYDVIVSLAYPISAGFGFRETVGVVFAGIGFSLVHIVVNSTIFALVVPTVVKKVIPAVPYFAQIN
jgi:uncharacterized membrane protein